MSEKNDEYATNLAGSNEKHDNNGKTVSHVEDSHTVDLIPEDSIDPVYHAKANVLNDAIQSIGMGKYQWHLFIVTGMGWFADNLWPVVTGIILPPVLTEFPGSKGPYLKLAQNIGLLVGAFFWGLGSDVWGRRVSFNITLLIVGVFAIAAGGSNNFTTLSAMAAVWSIGVGGNLPVDSAIFLEACPATHQYLLTVLSIWWAFGQLIGALVAWPLIANFSCPTTSTSCARKDNMGWRYFVFTMGGLMLLLWGIRFFVFKLNESPKYLMGRGRDEQAVENVHRIADYNGRSSDLSVEDLKKAASKAGAKDIITGEPGLDTSAKAAVLRTVEEFRLDHVRALFATKKLAYSSTLLIIIWALIGLAFPLYNAFITVFFTLRGTDFGDGSIDRTYRDLVILSVIGVPGAIIGGFMVDLPYLGRKGTLSLATISTGVFLFISTTARNSNALLGWNCAYSFTSNVMYGVLYAMTPEMFPTKDRGTGTGLAATANRIFGVMSPIVALYADLTTPVPIYVSGGLFIGAGFLALILPFETRGKASL
ncbi:hypothetical protein FRC14_002887 [Serendipita sp. 396]|nr:hypothetical protein FRC14_002887 [Serendipita sp. 396]KAG8787492.1 hypothetical protein FRC15_009082 [Serendipita sp. 397]KAG8803633.1 hypothetical protein FRC16_004185 [Serendipita sp. 398]KAG8874857.1 hypothetical protein FRC20_004971 [Serendipita sp. 405]